ncbi:MAG TPA: hypothetical protein VN753_03250 [Terracidiphilus sp.]|nr:hypothetical protein [Terracidiphilus sp.]
MDSLNDEISGASIEAEVVACNASARELPTVQGELNAMLVLRQSTIRRIAGRRIIFKHLSTKIAPG